MNVQQVGRREEACLEAVEEVIVEDEALPPHTKDTQNVPSQGLLCDAAVQPKIELLHHTAISNWLT